MLDKKKKETISSPKDIASTNDTSLSTFPSKDIIEEKKNNVKSSKNKNKNKGGLTMASTVPDLSIKIYEEQLPDGLEAFKERVQNIDKAEYSVMAILHNRDYVADEIFEESIKKAHLHILIIRNKIAANNKVDRRKVSTYLSLLGIVFREEDRTIWENRGVERIKDIGAAVAYLTHETEEAERNGKEVYDREEIISNLSKEEINHHRDGYIRLSKLNNKVSNSDIKKILEQAKEIGYKGLMSWEEFDETLPIPLRKGSNNTLIHRDFDKGVEKRMSENFYVNRLCIFIQGPANSGKTYSTRKVFNDTFKVKQINEGAGSGMFDDLTESHNVLIFDDSIMPNPLNMTDNKVTQAYKRQNNNPWWCGEYLIVTSNLSFENWARMCPKINRDNLEALRSRFYICEIVENKYIVCGADMGTEENFIVKSVSKRGGYEEQEIRRERFEWFMKSFIEELKKYNKEERKVDYSHLLKEEGQVIRSSV